MPKIEKSIWLSGHTAWYTLAIYKPLTIYSLGIPTQQLTLGTGQSLVTSFKSRCNTKYSRIQNSRLHMVNAKKPVLILPFSIKCNDSSRQIRYIVTEEMAKSFLKFCLSCEFSPNLVTPKVPLPFPHTWIGIKSLQISTSKDSK